MTKKILLIPLFFIFFLLQVDIAYSEKIAIKQHGNWFSMKVVEGNDSIYRAAAMASGGMAFITINVAKNLCNENAIMIAIPLGKLTDDTVSFDAFGDVRIDSGNVYDVSYTVQIVGNYIIAFLYSKNREHMILDMINGSNVRVAIDTGQKKITLTFPLNGVTTALKRMRAMCVREE